MDPHSRLSQFNQRPPKAGPAAIKSRHMDLLPLQKSPSLDRFTKKFTHDLRRPIATNSRIKKNERFSKDMYLAFVNNALQQKFLGDNESYDMLVDQFNVKKMSYDAPSPIPQLCLWLQALIHVVSRLDRTHMALIEAVLRLPWMTMDSSLVKTYTSFIQILVSARPEYLSLVLNRIAQDFTYQSGLQALDASLPESSSAPLTRRIVYDRIHHLLRHLLTLVPTLPTTLQPLLVQHFPHKRQSQASQITYIRNMLRITNYCPEIADSLLSTIIDRAIQIDVEIQVELEELEASGSAQEQADLFDLDPFDTVVGQEQSNDPGEDADGSEEGSDGFSDLSSEADAQDDDDAPPVAEPLDLGRITEMVNKLDAILKLLFDHFDRPPSPSPSPSTPSTPATTRLTSSPRPRSPSPAAETEESRTLQQLAQFHTLLAIFTRTILCTFRSRYTQFLLFWFASRNAAFADLFLGELVAHALLEPAQSEVARAAAASYVASFVSRAIFIGRDEARGAVRVLCRFLEHDADAFETGSGGAAPPSVFYAVAQAVFLIFCFRWRDLVEGDGNGEVGCDGEQEALAGPSKKMWMAELSIIQRVVACPLQPLKFCSENVARQFARVAHATGFMYVFPLLAAPPPARSAEQQLPALPSGSSINALSELTSFFPFDPYKLPRSSSYIEPIYREWAGVAIDCDEEEDEEEEEEEEMGERVAGQRRFGPVDRLDVEADGLGASFGGMSISPVPAPFHSTAVPLEISSTVV
ncbi:RNA polymerase I-specific transcription initiation factor RRN3 [Lactifluus volemus]|nr:RNA polymerase I-specific transcription initiation factor RRN3 [Lactifluus volemus]